MNNARNYFVGIAVSVMVLLIGLVILPIAVSVGNGISLNEALEIVNDAGAFNKDIDFQGYDLVDVGDVDADSISAPTGRTAAYVLAASNATALSKSQADYVCDGVADDIEIEAAINTYGNVTLTDGVFNLASDIDINVGASESFSFSGYGGGVDGVTRLHSSALSINLIHVQGLATGWEISDMVIDGDDKSGTVGVYVENGTHGRLSGLMVRNCADWGVFLKYNHSHKIYGCQIYWNGHDNTTGGIKIGDTGSPCNAVYIDGTEIGGSTGNGVVCVEGYGITINGSVIEGSSYHGIWMKDGTWHLTLESDYFEANNTANAGNYYDIYLQGDYPTIISNYNDTDSNVAKGVYATTDCSLPIIIGGRFYDGIDISSAVQPLVIYSNTSSSTFNNQFISRTELFNNYTQPELFDAELLMLLREQTGTKTLDSTTNTYVDSFGSSLLWTFVGQLGAVTFAGDANSYLRSYKDIENEFTVGFIVQPDYNFGAAGLKQWFNWWDESTNNQLQIYSGNGTTGFTVTDGTDTVTVGMSDINYSAGDILFIGMTFNNNTGELTAFMNGTYRSAVNSAVSLTDLDEGNALRFGEHAFVARPYSGDMAYIFLLPYILSADSLNNISNTLLNAAGNYSHIGQGETRTAAGKLSSGVANAIGFAWHDPEFQDILIKKVVIEVTTGGGTAGSHLDVGIADDVTGTNRGTEFFNDLLLNSVQINDSWVAGDGGTQTKYVLCQDSDSATDGWIVGEILDANASNLVGTYYIEYIGR